MDLFSILRVELILCFVVCVSLLKKCCLLCHVFIVELLMSVVRSTWPAGEASNPQQMHGGDVGSLCSHFIPV